MADRFRINGDDFAREARILMEMADNMPAVKRKFLRNIGNEARAALLDVYENRPMAGDQFPTKYTGKWGSSLRVNVDPRGNWVTIFTNIAYAAYPDEGRGPAGAIGGDEQDDIRRWMRDKLGADLTRAPGRKAAATIIRKIAEDGYKARQVFTRALSPYDSRGRQFISKTDDIANQMLEEVFNVRSRR